MLILLSPAKTLDFSRKLKSINHSETIFEEEANSIIQQHKEKDTTQWRQVMSMSEKLAELTIERFQNWHNDDTEQKQAGAAFKGEAYNGLDFPSLENDDLDYAQNHLRILSGMYGILRPFDIIKPYRLEMGSKLKPSLYEFWKEKITQHINETSDGPIVNLASAEYFKAIDQSKLNMEVLSVEFKEIKDGKPRTIVVYTKKARGLMARYIIQNRIENTESLKNFTEDGYIFNNELSNEENFVFTR